MAGLQEIEEHNHLHEAQSTERVDSHQHGDPGHNDISSKTEESGAVLSDHTPLASPNLSREEKKYRSNLRLLLAQVSLLHCGVLQNIICGADAISRSGSENKFECEKRRLERTKNYERMHELAMDANVCAKNEKEAVLEVRSKFWLGRSCGGTDDDETALKYFRTAKKLHTSNPSRLPIEEAGIDDLISYCMKRWEKRKERSEKLNKRASQQMEKQGIISDVCMVQDSSPGPVWAFDHERNLERAKGDLEQNVEWATQYFKKHPLPVAAAPRSIPKALKPTSPAEKAVAQAGKSVPQAGKPIPQVHSPPTSQPIAPTPKSAQERPRLVTFEDQSGHVRTTQEVAGGTAKRPPPRKTSTFRRKPSLARRDTQRSGRSVLRMDLDASILRSRSILGRRDTRGSSRSFRSYKSATSSTSPERINLHAEIAKLDGGWDGYDDEEDWMDEDSESEGL